ncbi:hypothetical protein P152DRAFT_455276 [Eremomyces bilateralis CBS 781.70]|uniref:Uncharacterized protein n=1 Tax=Eremomyces bilateralis CBS 781.70 TaxID=1392243 RepID=A0A6G1GCD1_9PEZI|nr:uncharacterized protein P152DRAFT_455276 [Eremomyces bilateralis CBS 781.70]KAF1815561.1 hypothetical protein P152DRAFT_455276 [Eremomyces bilateralis CBS 781.70]
MRAIATLFAGVVLFFSGTSALPLADIEDVEPDYSVQSTSFDGIPTIDLEPVVSLTDDGHLSKRRDALDLRDAVTLYWKQNKANAILQVEYLGENELVINMDDFGDVLENVDCSPPEMSLDFKDRESFEAAITKWNWVNENENRHFIMFVNHPKCGPDHSRTPFNITDVDYDEERYITYLTAHELEYSRAIHDGHLRIETTAAPTNQTNNGYSTTLSKRIDISKSFSLKKDFTTTMIDTGDATSGLSLACTDCGTDGTINVALDVKISWFKIKHVFIEYGATNALARVNLALNSRGDLVARQAGTVEFYSYTIIGVNIPKIGGLSFGPSMGAGWAVGPIKGNASMTWGATAQLTPVSNTKICLKGCESSSEGWQVEWIKTPPSATAHLSAGLEVSTYLKIAAGAYVFSTGYEAGIALKAPQFKATIDATASPEGGACGNPDSRFGINTDIEVGAKMFAYIGKDHEHPAKEFNFFEKMVDLYDQCFVIS